MPRNTKNIRPMALPPCPNEGHPPVPLRGTARAVVKYLKETFPRPSSPKEIALMTGCSYAAVRKVCTRNKTHIAQARRGLYRYFADAQSLRYVDLPEPKIHAVCIVSPVTQRQGGALRERATEGQSWFWRGRRVTVQYWSGKRRKQGARLAVFLAASQKPLTVPEFMAFLPEWAGVVRAYGVDPDDPRNKVRELDVNADFPWPKVGLRGMESMTLYGFRHGLLKAYHKRSLNALRLEACLWPVDLQPAEVARIFGELTRPLLEKQEPVVPGPPGPEVA